MAEKKSSEEKLNKIRLLLVAIAAVVVLAVIFVSVVFPTTAKQSAPCQGYRDTTLNFCIDGPVGWQQVTGDPDPEIRVTFLSSASDLETPASIMVSAFGVGRSDSIKYLTEDVAKSNLAGSDTLMSDVRVLESKDVRIADGEGRDFIMAYTYDGDEFEMGYSAVIIGG